MNCENCNEYIPQYDQYQVVNEEIFCIECSQQRENYIDEIADYCQTASVEDLKQILKNL